MTLQLSKNLFWKIWLICFSLFLVFNIQATHAEDCAAKEWYSRYLCQISSTCDSKYRKDSDGNVFNTDKVDRSYQEWYNLYIAKNLYRQNMNNIYKCAILKSQNDSYDIILNKLNITNPSISIFTSRIQEQKTNITEEINNIDCVKTSPQKSGFGIKKQILDESTLEMCKYLHFLDYVDTTHVKDIWNLIKDREISQQVEQVFEQNPSAGIEAYLDLSNVDDYEFKKEKYTLQDILALQVESNKEIQEEIEHTKRVYEVAFQTYANYELNMVVHLLFDMLENDFRQVRDKIYAMLGPINQVAYKIPNATSY